MIRDPGAFQLLADETRLSMIYLLRAKEMTVSQIAAELGLTPQTIYHHIKKLREVDMVEVSREERIDHLVESYFRATAGMFHFVNGTCVKEGGVRQSIENALKALESLGHAIDTNSTGINKIQKLSEKLNVFREDPKILDKTYELDDIDPFTQRYLVEFAMMMEMPDRDFEAYLETQRNLREWLLSQQRK